MRKWTCFTKQPELTCRLARSPNYLPFHQLLYHLQFIWSGRIISEQCQIFPRFSWVFSFNVIYSPVIKNLLAKITWLLNKARGFCNAYVPNLIPISSSLFRNEYIYTIIVLELLRSTKVTIMAITYYTES